MIQAEPINARFVGGPLDGETHRLAHRLPFVQVPGPGESFFARLHVERPADVPDERLYTVQGADDPETLVYHVATRSPEPAADAGATATATDAPQTDAGGATDDATPPADGPGGRATRS
ncbi:MAG: hypothetical protein M0P31_00885 [Solirubrobacteraceae bacterium]|nr:hypothetical protein [Solirubrobacteraceae bacterium]